MRTDQTTKFVIFACVVVMFVAACGSTDDAAEPAPVPTLPTSTSTAVAGDETVTLNAEPEEVDERTSEEIALDQLDLMIYQLGSQDLEGAANCVIERLESEGVPVTGQGAPELVALLGCEPEAVDSLLEIDDPTVPLETRDCITRAVGSWMASLPLTEASTFFEAAAPPAELISSIAASCSIGEDEVATLLG